MSEENLERLKRALEVIVNRALQGIVKHALQGILKHALEVIVNRENVPLRLLGIMPLRMLHEGTCATHLIATWGWHCIKQHSGDGIASNSILEMALHQTAFWRWHCIKQHPGDGTALLPGRVD